MKRICYIFLSLILIPILTSCGKKTNEIPFDTLIESVEEDDLGWTTFKKYDYTEKDSGLLYRTYDVEGDYVLEISGRDKDSNPYSYKLTNTKTKESIDILEDDIIAFLGDDY